MARAWLQRTGHDTWATFDDDVAKNICLFSHTSYKCHVEILRREGGPTKLEYARQATRKQRLLTEGISGNKDAQNTRCGIHYLTSVLPRPARLHPAELNIHQYQLLPALDRVHGYQTVTTPSLHRGAPTNTKLLIDVASTTRSVLHAIWLAMSRDMTIASLEL